ncbi:hypothetical protein BDN70DRAFT_995500 [Pholiota conissans]|uniref:Peptide hydrolase n=1 Tax=Pholiota conissans TaxID=109636 RepID=A0A9P5YWW0_9AGAR|nr:hypothetical protein BDN70DRAFT_995500 [Pholiota conissans]
MTLAAKAAAVFGYRVWPTSLLTFVTYLAIIIAIVVTNVLPAVPKAENQGGLSVAEAYEDLRYITAHPHPYNSHANDKVHEYLLSRLTAISVKYPHVHVVNDLTSNKTWFSQELGGAHGEYFEGTNLLVKVDGTAGASSGGVLFSAHYDSVSTACGATDDGMGVVTLVQLVKFFAENRLPRTAVFNINNGEEDGLHGAHMFLEHPWSSLTDTFLNLEGAASGGRPILFRATSTTPVRALHDKKRMPHPHANVLSSDAFARGLIKSGTDFSVYVGSAGMAGLDLAFYRGRSMYHTKYDSMQYTVGGQKSLWSMMEAARGIGIGLLSEPLVEKVNAADFNDDAVYFDLFKSKIIVFRLKNLLTFNVISLIAGPTFLALLLFCESFFRRTDDTRPLLHDDASARHVPPTHSRNNSGQGLPGIGRRRPLTPVPGAHPEDEDEDEDDHLHRRSEEAEEPNPAPRSHAIWRHTKFWVALFAILGLQVLLGWSYVVINPFAIYSSPYFILFSFSSLVYLVLVNVLTLPSSLPFFHPKSSPAPSTSHLRPAQQQKQTLFFHLYAFTWILLLLGTLGITLVHPGIGGGYLVSAWNACVGIACALTVLEGLFTSAKDKKTTEEDDGDEYDELTLNEGDSGAPRGRREDADESTPLIWREQQQHRAVGSSRTGHHFGARGEEAVGKDGGGLATCWWIAQFLVSVPVPVILFGQIATLLLDSVPQTLADGGAPWLVYALVSLPAFFLILPLAPFSYKLRPCRPLTLLILAIFIGTTLYAWLTFPFSVQAPLKIFFRQSVGFPRQSMVQTSAARTAHSSSNADLALNPTVITSLTGAKKYLRTHLIPTLPSAKGKRVWCRDETFRPGLTTCEWESNLLPSPGSHGAFTDAGAGKATNKNAWADNANQFFKAQVKSTGPNSAFISIKGHNTRVCRLYFDSLPIEKYAVRHLDKAALKAPSVPWPAPTPAGARRDTGDQAPFEVKPSANPVIKEVHLWSRTWEPELGIDFSWAASPNSTAHNNNNKDTTLMEGRIACEWAEYESGMVDNGALALDTGKDGAGAGGLRPKVEQIQSGAKIPALEEALAYLPDWAVITKYSDGLVEAWTPFVV